MELSAIHVYPVKSCAGLSVESWELGRTGLERDREWMVIDAEGTFLTQRELPAMACIRPELDGDGLRLSAPGMPELEVDAPGDSSEGRVACRVWGFRLQGVDQGEGAARWLGEYLSTPCRLVRVPPDFDRRVNPRRFEGEAYTALSDGYPLLLIGEASLADLNGRMARELPMNRFRPNLVVRGSDAYAEDGWRRIRVGRRGFAFTKPCERCAITTVDQATGRRGDDGEPLRTLAGYRRSPKGALFGVNLVHLDRGPIQVGDPVQVEAGE